MLRKCEFCQEPLEENVTVCPHCGKAVTETAPDQQEAAPEEQPQEAAPEQAAFEEETPAETIAEFAAENQELPEPEKKKMAPGKLALAVGGIVVLAAILIAVIVSGMNKPEQEMSAVTEPAVAVTEQPVETVPATVPADGNPENETCKGSYTVSDAEAIAAKDTVVATIGDRELTNGEMQVYYWSMVNSYLSSEYGYYMMMYGALDYTKPLDTQICLEDQSLTWQQYFLKEALDYWQLSTALAGEAQKSGVQMSEADREYMENLPASLEETAASYSMTLEELMLNNIGPGGTVEEFIAFQQLYCEGKDYYQQKLAEMKPTEEELEAFFDSHADGYAESGITKDANFVDVRHILIGVDGGTADESGVLTFTEEEWAAAEVKAQEVLDQWLAGEKTEDSFAALANEKSQDPGSNTNGGLYQNVYVGQMVKPFEDWCFDAERAYGDYGIVKTDYGYHIMFYVGSEPMWISYAENDWITEQTNVFMEGLASSYPIDVNYENISLGYINLGG